MVRAPRIFASVVAAFAFAGPALAAPKAAPPPKPDLADIAAGDYDGSVISDARGAGRSGVHITVAKTGPNTVSVTSDYPRLPPFTTKLTRAMQTIQMVHGPQVFLLDLAKTPKHLDVTDDDASFSGARTGE